MQTQKGHLLEIHTLTNVYSMLGLTLQFQVKNLMQMQAILMIHFCYILSLISPFRGAKT